ncbi:MAG: (d)CMP kinase [Owenweeksia sp.]|nr:(d)CMP kinase [Owenweeksia sp.]
MAHLLNYRYVDTGAMYRALTLYALREGLIENRQLKEAQLIEALPTLHLDFRFNPEKNTSDVYLNDENIEMQIREMDVAKWVSQVAAVSEVRKFLVKQQQALAADKQVVMDGRDIGTVVLPKAELEVFVAARDPVRVQRRYDELKAKGREVTRQEVEANLEQRDFIDTTRSDSPLKLAEDARYLDNSDITPEQQLAIVHRWVKEILHKH